MTGPGPAGRWTDAGVRPAAHRAAERLRHLGFVILGAPTTF
ncbi:hypothetical protein TOK_2596 [Pseudonocardia sp. N23]|nr:hypothetical protein TOK_2596 [Pseudonocardia sp. N23]